MTATMRTAATATTATRRERRRVAGAETADGRPLPDRTRRALVRSNDSAAGLASEAQRATSLIAPRISASDGGVAAGRYAVVGAVGAPSVACSSARRRSAPSASLAARSYIRCWAAIVVLAAASAADAPSTA